MGAAQVQRHRARAVRQVPHHQRSGRVRCSGDGGHVVHGAGAVVHVGQHQYRHVGGQGSSNLFGLHQLQRVATLFTQAFSYIEIGREVAAFTYHHAALRRILLGDGQRGR